ncbi:acyl-CoA N-acyltransferase [Xylariaceae sp. FL0255]|nr:acyl-CoA N-acyltransferase [Xylariaceae sp. FL0255]
MAPSHVHLPDGQSFTIQPVFGGLFFKSNELNTHPAPFPVGWSITLQTGCDGHHQPASDDQENHEPRLRRFTSPTLKNDSIFISSISLPSSSDFKPHPSPSRQIALMLWISLYWYFQQPEPDPYVKSPPNAQIPHEAMPKGEWRIHIKRDGIFRTKNMIPKLERMGLITSTDTSAGTGLSEKEQGWVHMSVSRSAFWQLHSGLFLFTLQPLRSQSLFSASPISSRPASPVRSDSSYKPTSVFSADLPGGPIPTTLASQPSFPVGPYYSSSHLPTFYPPPPLQYAMTKNIRHPRRQKPPRMGETFYARFIPSVGKYLSFRVASLSPDPVPHLGPVSKLETTGEDHHAHLCSMSDDSLLREWLSKSRVSAFWGTHHPGFLPTAMNSQHSFPAIGLWDGVPFGYFEIYWVKEDLLGQTMGNDAQDFDRGMHVLVGEEWARGRVATWLSSLVHYCLQADNRTMNVYLEPRVDNERFIKHLQVAGFAKERQISFHHKQAWLCHLRRDVWDGPTF